MIKRIITATVALFSVFVYISLTTEHNFFINNLPEVFISYFIYIIVYILIMLIDKKIRKKS